MQPIGRGLVAVYDAIADYTTAIELEPHNATH